jgi:multidrug efflux pump subunit AcrB
MEDISRGDDPVYAFGMRLRQRRFTQADFAVNSLNRPQPMGNFSTRFSGSWMAFEWFKTQKMIRSAELMRKSSESSATDISNAVLKRVHEAQGITIPADVTITTTRNYGETAKAKSDELLEHLLLARLSVTLLVAIFLGWRKSGVVLLAIPVTLALTMPVFYLMGYTINRVTLFALIFSIGILVDDAIVVVENMVRHFRLAENHGRPMSEVAVEAVAEVGNPTILATFAVIAAVLPMAFVRGLMGPYMRPIPVGASAAMLFSLLVAFVVSPWAALRFMGKQLRGVDQLEPEQENWRTRVYRRVMTPLLRSRRNRLL